MMYKKSTFVKFVSANFAGYVSNVVASLFWQPHVVHGAGAGGELREYESGGLGAGHGLVGVDERELLPELGGCKMTKIRVE